MLLNGGGKIMAKTTTIRHGKIYSDLEKLSSRRKKEAGEFIAYLRALEEVEATKEVMSDRDFVKSIMRGDEDFKAGRFKSWRGVREDV
jgi:hypothetical protein